MDDRYADNKYIKMAAEEFAANRSEEKLFQLFNVLLKRMLDEGEAPMPMVDVNNAMADLDLSNLGVGNTFQLKQDMRLRIDTVHNGTGVEWIPLYTDEKEMSLQPTTNISVNMGVYDILASALRSDRADGLVINPFSLGLIVPKDILRIVVERFEKMKEENEDFRNI